MSPLAGTRDRTDAGSRRDRRIRMGAALGLACLVLAATAGAQPETPRVPEPAPTTRVTATAEQTAPAAPRTFEVQATVEASGDSRDSLMQEIRQHTAMIRALRDSLRGDELDLNLSPERRAALQKNIDDISKVIEQIGSELSDLEFEVKDNRISLLNDSGEGIVINIPERLPENLDAQVTEGLKTLSQIILKELPDSLQFDKGKRFEWKSFLPHVPPPPRRVVHGNQVRVRDDVTVDIDEDVRGDVVAVFGDGLIEGRVDGDAVVVFGDLTLGPRAEVTGTVVSVGGSVVRDPAAKVGELHSVDIFGGRDELSLSAFLSQKLLSFAVFQVLFLLVILLTIIAVVASPGSRFENVTGHLRNAPGAAFGLGLVAGLAALLVLPVLLLVLVATFVGIPVALLLAVAVSGMLIVAVAAAASVIGENLCRGLGDRCRTPWMTTVVGLLALYLVFFLGTILNAVGGAGGMAVVLMLLGLGVNMLAATFGLGSLVLTRFGARVPRA